MINVTGGKISYLAWIVAAVGAVAACDSAVDNYVGVSLEAASEPSESLTISPLAACEQVDLLQASLELASLSLTLLTS